MKKICLTVLLIGFFTVAYGQDYRNPNLSAEQRVEDLLSRMTSEEKFFQLFMIPGGPVDDPGKFKTGIFGFQFNTHGKAEDVSQQLLAYSKGDSAFEAAREMNDIQRFFIENSRLGIPVIFFDEALHGLVREGATAFPQAIALAATWNPDLVYRAAKAIARECRSRGIRQVLSPVVNLADDVRWGRTEETYGEDPFLASEMGTAFVSAFEQMNVITTPKHFIANAGAGGRDSYPIHWTERFMRETHFLPFEACIKKGGSRSVMTAYNSYDGTPCTAHDWLLNTVLKEEWGFRGFVISDAGGTGGANVLHMTAADYPDAAAKSLAAGLDVIFQTHDDHSELFLPPFLDGRIDEKTIDAAVSRVLLQKFELGLFENPYAEPELAAHYHGHPEHRRLAKDTALESIVLLKNENRVLPLTKNLRSIAVIGRDAVEARLGGYSGPGVKKVSILEGIKKLAGADMEVRYAPGCGRVHVEYVTIPSETLFSEAEGERQNGLRGEYYDNIAWEGRPVVERIDPQIDFRWTLFSPDPEKLSFGFYSVRWTGKLKAPKTGTYQIGIDGNDGYRLYLDEELIIDNRIKRSRRVSLEDYDFEAGREYDIKIEYHEPVGNAWFRLVWNIGVRDESPEIEQAVELAARSDVAIIAAGIEEGEFQDRALLGLPGRQEEMIKKAAATGTPVIVVLVGGSAVTMTGWMDDVPGIVAVWYPGEEGGNAVAEVLFGMYNPAGRLPFTWPVHEGQLPLVYNHKPTGRGDDYMNLTGQPLFPFGFGLSYTSFAYSEIQPGSSMIAASESASFSVKIANTGETAGDEVVQLYIADEFASVARPVMELKGFKRIHLEPGETGEVEFMITPEMLSMLDKDLKRTIEPGRFRIMIGSSSKDIRQRAFLTVVAAAAQSRDHRWVIHESGGITRRAEAGRAFHDHLEMSGKFISAVVLPSLRGKRPVLPELFERVRPDAAASGGLGRDETEECPWLPDRV